MGKVLFTSRRPLGRCENITAVYNAYGGEKDFIQENWGRPDPRIKSGEFTIMVADDFVPYSPGKLIMLTHGCSGGKSYGLRQPYAYHTKEQAKLIDYVVSTSMDTVPLEAEQHGVPESKVLPLGMPRTDAYFGKKKGDGGTMLENKRVYLYAPTFRKPFEPRRMELDWLWLDEMLTDDEVFIIKPHMVTGSIFKSRLRHVYQVPSSFPSAPYLIDCDVLITDYSSIMFDAHILGKPVVLIEKENGFVQKRGMSYPYPEGYASRYATNDVELLRLIRAADKPGKEDIACRERNCGACDGHSTERVVELIRRVNEGIDRCPNV